MEITQLLYFLEVAEQKSFTGAAKNLHVSQPAISKMIRALEDELGVVLFDRSSRRVELTDYGLAVQSQVKILVQSFHGIQNELADVTHLRQGSIRIGIPPMVGEMFFPEIIGRFHKQYPKIKIKLTEVGSKKVEELVKDGSVDVGVAVLPVDVDEFEIYEITKNPMMLVVHADHPLAERKKVAFSDLRGESFILYRSDFALHELINDACHLAGFKPDIICETSQWDFMAKTVAAQLGIALLPNRVCQELRRYDQIRAVEIEAPRLYWHLALIWRKYSYMSNASRLWISFAKLHFADITRKLDFWNMATPS